jgi:hypothetical protein
MLDLLARTGFRNAQLLSLTGGIVAIYYAEKMAENNAREFVAASPQESHTTRSDELMAG